MVVTKKEGGRISREYAELAWARLEIPGSREDSEISVSRKTSPFIEESSEQAGEQEILGRIIGPRL